MLGEQVNISFTYTTDEAGGVRIWAQPFTNGALSPGQAYQGSSLLPTGQGTTGRFFTINSGATTVDQVRLQMWTADQSALLFETFVSVKYTFSAHSISGLVFSPASPATLVLGEQVNISFTYTTDDAGGVRIWAQPFTNGALSPGQAFQGSSILPTGKGTTSRFFTIKGSAATVDQVRLQMWTADQSALLFETFVSVKYTFSGGLSAPSWSSQPETLHGGVEWAGSTHTKEFPMATPLDATEEEFHRQVLRGDLEAAVLPKHQKPAARLAAGRSPCAAGSLPRFRSYNTCVPPGPSWARMFGPAITPAKLCSGGSRQDPRSPGD